MHKHRMHPCQWVCCIDGNGCGRGVLCAFIVSHLEGGGKGCRCGVGVGDGLAGGGTAVAEVPDVEGDGAVGIGGS